MKSTVIYKYSTKASKSNLMISMISNLFTKLLIKVKEVGLSELNLNNDDGEKYNFLN